MKDGNAQTLLAKAMGWSDTDVIQQNLPPLQLLADYKYDEYQRYGPGRRFIESLALWLFQFELGDRENALALVQKRLIFVSEDEIAHLVQSAYQDVIVQNRIRLLAEETGIPPYMVGKLSTHPRFNDLRLKTLYLGLSDGAHTNDLRRSSLGQINNEQIWQAYELGDAKSDDMLEELRKALKELHVEASESRINCERFSIIWLIDDFSGSGNTYIRFDASERKFKGKIKKIYERIHQGSLINSDYYEVNLLLYVATRQAIDHIEYWSEQYTREMGYCPLNLHVLWPIESDAALSLATDSLIMSTLNKPEYYDVRASDRHIAVGGTADAQLGFAKCALPLVLSHNTPNNSVYALWGPEEFAFFGLFPRVSRHRES